jgi:putative transposase
MSRPLRIEFEDALYHAPTLGHRREPIFGDDSDRSALLATIGQGIERFDAMAFAYLQGGRTQTDIARATGLSVSRVSRLIAANGAKGKT